MAAYLVVDTLLDNPELYEQYKLKAKPLVEQYGGEYWRGGALTLKGDRTLVPNAAGAGEIPRCRNRPIASTIRPSIRKCSRSVSSPRGGPLSSSNGI